LGETADAVRESKAAMQRLTIAAVIAVLLALTGCSSVRTPTTATTLEPDIRKKIARGIVEPGFTPEMVYLALGKPSEPTENLADATRDGTWVYRHFERNDRDFVRAGFRRRVVFDPVRKSDVIITEPVDPRSFPALEPHSMHITFHDGRVVEIKRIAAL
jgi:hypothetical protein